MTAAVRTRASVPPRAAWIASAILLVLMLATILAAVAYALGYPADGDPGVFLDDYRRTARRVRAIVERVFYGW